jgi:putative hydrolase of HD superfamily
MELYEEELHKQMAFLREIDNLKNVVRKSPLIDKSRKENSAEHSWHLAMYAMILHRSANKPVNLSRVIQMLLIHDIVEIDAGDHPIHELNSINNQEALELKAADRIFGLLPAKQEKEYRTLWLEFEASESDDAIFAKSLDRFQPLIHNVETDGGTWTESDVSKEQVEDRYGPAIINGSKSLWKYALTLVNKHFNHVF